VHVAGKVGKERWCGPSLAPGENTMGIRRSGELRERPASRFRKILVAGISATGKISVGYDRGRATKVADLAIESLRAFEGGGAGKKFVYVGEGDQGLSSGKAPSSITGREVRKIGKLFSNVEKIGLMTRREFRPRGLGVAMRQKKRLGKGQAMQASGRTACVPQIHGEVPDCWNNQKKRKNPAMEIAAPRRKEVGDQNRQAPLQRCNRARREFT